jgi:hypothetical protein
MSTTLKLRCLVVASLLLGLPALGCDQDDAPTKKASGKETPRSAATKKVPIGKNVVLEIEGDKRRVLVNAEVCRRTDQLEQLLCRKRTKEHEAILAADVDARDIHKALLLTGAEQGSPVKYVPRRTPPTGTVIKVTLQYQDQGRTVTVPAQKWVRDVKTRKELEHPWVFAGSVFIPDPLDKTVPPFYGANDGDVICLANFETAMLDLPIESSKDAGDLSYEAFTERIPALETPVLVILEPVPAKKKAK